MKKCIFTICLFLAIFIPNILLAANYYIREGATGTGVGIEWGVWPVRSGVGDNSWNWECDSPHIFTYFKVF